MFLNLLVLNFLFFIGVISLNPLKFRAFCKHPSKIQSLSLLYIELLFHFKYPISLNIAVKLNEKMRKITKGILVISHPSVRI
jgi:hypothetical protein